MSRHKVGCPYQRKLIWTRLANRHRGHKERLASKSTHFPFGRIALLPEMPTDGVTAKAAQPNRRGLRGQTRSKIKWSDMGGGVRRAAARCSLWQMNWLASCSQPVSPYLRQRAPWARTIYSEQAPFSFERHSARSVLRVMPHIIFELTDLNNSNCGTEAP